MLMMMWWWLIINYRDNGVQWRRCSGTNWMWWEMLIPFKTQIWWITGELQLLIRTCIGSLGGVAAHWGHAGGLIGEVVYLLLGNCCGSLGRLGGLLYWYSIIYCGCSVQQSATEAEWYRVYEPGISQQSFWGKKDGWCQWEFRSRGAESHVISIKTNVKTLLLKTNIIKKRSSARWTNVLRSGEI